MPNPITWCLWLNGTGWSARCPCRVTHGDLCSWSSATPRAITINPVKTRLARANAFELRSKICAMNTFLLPQVTQAKEIPKTVCGRFRRDLLTGFRHGKSYRLKDEYSSSSSHFKRGTSLALKKFPIEISVTKPHIKKD